MTSREGTLGDPLALPSARPKRVVQVKAADLDPEELLGNARQALAAELKRLNAKAIVGLDSTDIKNLTMLTDAACKLAREERDALKSDDFTKKSKEELRAIVEGALGALAGP